MKMRNRRKSVRSHALQSALFVQLDGQYICVLARVVLADGREVGIKQNQPADGLVTRRKIRWEAKGRLLGYQYGRMMFRMRIKSAHMLSAQKR